MVHNINVRVNKSWLERHCLLVGSTGAGKSVLMSSMFYDLVRTSNAKRQHSVCLIEPHGDFSAKIAFAKIIPRDRLVYVSSTINREAGTDGYACIINPFEHDNTSQMVYLLTTELTSAIGELLADTTTPLTVQMTMLLRNCISVTLKCRAIGLEPSLEVLCRFFSSKDEVGAELVALGQRSENSVERMFFLQDFDNQLYTQTKVSLRTKLLYFLSDSLLFSMLCGKSTINLLDSLEQGKVIIFQIPKGASKFVSSVFGRLMIAYINTLMLRREAIDPKKRKPCFLFIDEFQTLLTSSLASSLQEVRKYRLALILATQSLKQLESHTLKKTIIVNTGVRAISLSDHQDRKDFSAEMGVTPEALATLEPLQFMIKKNDGKSTAFRFRVQILSSHLFYEGEQKLELLHYLIHESGLYVKISPPPAPPPSENKDEDSKKSNNTSTGKRKDNPFNGQIPAFKS
jgi:hypothetical protein